MRQNFASKEIKDVFQQTLFVLSEEYFCFCIKKCTLVPQHSSVTNIFKKQVFHFVYMWVNYSDYSNDGKRYDKENKPVVFVHINNMWCSSRPAGGAASLDVWQAEPLKVES